jgi:hypothetical protein
MKSPCVAILLLLPLVFSHAQDRTVLLAARRAGTVEVLDPDTLHSFGSIKVLPLADGIESGSRGMIFLREGLAPEFKGCCALYALDLNTRAMTILLEPISEIVVSPDGEHVITQRGNVGVETFNAHTLQREPHIPSSIAPGVYGFCFSRDGRFLFGASNFPAPTLDVLDFSARRLVRHFALPQEFAIVGACADNSYYLYGQRKTSARLWRMRTAPSTLGAPAEITFPDRTPECEMHDERVLIAGDRLFIAESFGGKLDRRLACGRGVSGGLLLIDPQTGRVLKHLAPELHFAQLISSADGKKLYGIDVKDANWRAVSMIQLDAVTGRILVERDLVPDVWSMTLTTIPIELVPRGQLEATTK